MAFNSPGEKFDTSLYENLLLEDRNMIDEYIPKMTPGEINSFMKRLVEHYKVEKDEAVEVEEDKDSIIVFENTNITKVNLRLFTEQFVSTTKSSEDINEFFLKENNYNFVVQNPQFYKNNSPAFSHIIKFFNLSRSLKTFLDNKKELDGFVWDGIRTYFENKKTYSAGLYPYIGSFVSRQLRQDLDFGFICPFCSTFYARTSNDKKTLVTCYNCKNSFSFFGIKCPIDTCNKIVPISSIDINTFDKNNTKHLRAIRALKDYMDDGSIRHIADKLKIELNDILYDGYKIPISEKLQKQKLKKLPEYGLHNNIATSVSEFLFYLPLVCPVTSGHTRTKQINGKKRDVFGGCGATFILKDGLREVKYDGYVVYNMHEPRKVKYLQANKYYNYDNLDNAISSNEYKKTVDAVETDNKIPFDKIINHLDKYFNKYSSRKNKSMIYLSSAIKKYFEEEYSKSLSFLESNAELSSQDKQYIMSFDNFLSDKKLQNNLYYNAENYFDRVGWTPDNEAKDRIRENYIGLVQHEEKLVRKIHNAKLPLSYYTYRISEIHGRPTTYKKRIGIAIDKTVLPATKRAAAGYGQNFKMDIRFIDVNLIANNKKISLTPFIRNAVYWSHDNAIIHGFDNKTGIIWFDGEPIDDEHWRFPNGLIVDNNSDTTVSAICATDAFSKMFQRFDLNNKLREVVLELESE